MECTVNNLSKSKTINDESIKKIVFKVLKRMKCKNGEVSVNFVSENKIKAINKKYRKKDKITDVISFSAQEGEMVGEEKDLGDIFICIKKIKNQAKEYRVRWEEELTRMLVHGVLHLLGYDHLRASDEKKMIGLQEKIVKTNVKQTLNKYKRR